MKAIKTTPFIKQEKKLNANQKRDLDKAVQVILDDLYVGRKKKGALNWLYVYKFKRLIN